MDNFKKAYDLLKAWKGDSYICGLGCLEEIGSVAKKYAGEGGSGCFQYNIYEACCGQSRCSY